MLARYPHTTSNQHKQRSANAPLWWGTAVFAIFLALLFAWLLPQVTGLTLLGLWVMAAAIAALTGGLLSLRHPVLAPQWSLLFVGQFLGITAVFLFLIAA